MKNCQTCGAPLAQPAHGRTRHYCSDSCRLLRACDLPRVSPGEAAVDPSWQGFARWRTARYVER